MPTSADSATLQAYGQGVEHARAEVAKDLPRTRKDAKAEGVGRYFTGLPCPKGHVTWRLVSSAACSACSRDAAASRKAVDPEHTRRLGRESYVRHAEKNREKAKAWTAKNPERVAANKRRHGLIYRAANKDRIQAHRKQWYDENRARLVVMRREKRLAAAEIYRERNRVWKKENPAAVAAWNRRRRELKKAAGGELTAADIADVTAAQSGRCAMCGVSGKLTVDHIMPLSRGGEHSRRNVQMLCGPCNSRKGASHPAEFVVHGGSV